MESLLADVSNIIRAYEKDVQSKLWKLKTENEDLHLLLSMTRPDSRDMRLWSLTYETDNGEGAPIFTVLGCYQNKAEACEAKLRALKLARQRFGQRSLDISFEKQEFVAANGETVFIACVTEDEFGEPSGGPIGIFATREDAQRCLRKAGELRKTEVDDNTATSNLCEWVEEIIVGTDNFDPFE